MPRYDFVCLDCNTVYEVTCKIAEKNNSHPCPTCNSEKTESRILTAPGLADAVRMGVNQHQKAFKEVLQKIHTKTPGSVLNKTADIK